MFNQIASLYNAPSIEAIKFSSISYSRTSQFRKPQVLDPISKTSSYQFGQSILMAMAMTDTYVS
jgi:hypothetical protein